MVDFGPQLLSSSKNSTTSKSGCYYMYENYEGIRPKKSLIYVRPKSLKPSILPPVTVKVNTWERMWEWSKHWLSQNTFPSSNNLQIKDFRHELDMMFLYLIACSGFPFHDIVQLYSEHTLTSPVDGDKYSQWKSGFNSAMTNSALFWRFHIKLSMHFFNLP